MFSSFLHSDAKGPVLYRAFFYVCVINFFISKPLDREIYLGYQSFMKNWKRADTLELVQGEEYSFSFRVMW
ncbi:hypothetical protein [Desulfobaculum bizertense]|uniref:Uncharacterized protein n=1 Tax=Desulfobaculum bizertense DSM 18034 TaxID=1121442 RepID=A0A1T4VNN2_9BACT|nr:hypothetical protein [Desulfobaculum bizertense]SKA66539.1 hypothetical protein SAMN02745702_00615 [Desulfobaculum bizertense DSM 18034]